MATIEQYNKLMREVLEFRNSNEDSIKKEDDLLDEMDKVWDELTEEDHKKINNIDYHKEEK